MVGQRDLAAHQRAVTSRRLQRLTADQLEEDVLRVIRARLSDYRGLEDLLRAGHGTVTLSLTMREWEWQYPKVGVETTSPSGQAA